MAHRKTDVMKVHIYVEEVSSVPQVLGAAAGRGGVGGHHHHPAAVLLHLCREPLRHHITSQWLDRACETPPITTVGHEGGWTP